MSYQLHKALSSIATDIEYAFGNNDLGMIHRIIEGDLSTAYVIAKELEEHGYEAFCELVKQYDEGEF